MSPAMSALATVGINGHAMILLFIVLVTCFVIGALWQAILPGAVVLAMLYLFTPPASETTTQQEAKTEAAAEVKTEVKNTDEDTLPVKRSSAYNEFMQDCTTVGGYTAKRCDNKWNDRDLPDDRIKGEVKDNKPLAQDEKVSVETGSSVRLLDVSNTEYVKHRAEALKNPNSVVMHTTIR